MEEETGEGFEVEDEELHQEEAEVAVEVGLIISNLYVHLEFKRETLRVI